MRAKDPFSSSGTESQLRMDSVYRADQRRQSSVPVTKIFLPTFVLVLLTFFMGKDLFGQQNANRRVDHAYVENEKLTEQVIFLTYDDQFKKALELVDKMTKDEPNSIQWRYFRVMILWRELAVLGWGPRSRQKNLVDRIGDELFSLKKIVDSVSSGSSESVKTLFYKGAIYGYLGMYYSGIKDENLKAIGVGKDGIDCHKRVLQLDPTCYDAYYSLGVYNYYASMVPWYLKPFLFVFGMAGSEEKAEKYLRLVVEKGTLAKYEAMEMLASLYERQKQVDSAGMIYRRLIQEFPDACYRYYFEFGIAYSNCKKRDEMARTFQEAINRSNIRQPSEEEVRYLVNTYLLLGSDFLKMGRNEEAVSLYKQALGRNLGYQDRFYYSLGVAYEKLGNKTLAIQSYQSVKGDGLTKEAYQKVQERLSELLKK